MLIQEGLDIIFSVRGCVSGRPVSIDIAFLLVNFFNNPGWTKEFLETLWGYDAVHLGMPPLDRPGFQVSTTKMTSLFWNPSREFPPMVDLLCQLGLVGTHQVGTGSHVSMLRSMIFSYAHVIQILEG